MDTEQRLDNLERQMKEHYHNGVVGRQIMLNDLFGSIKTVTVAGDLTAILAGKPKTISQQILIDTTTATKKLYVYDIVGATWYSVTIT